MNETLLSSTYKLESAAELLEKAANLMYQVHESEELDLRQTSKLGNAYMWTHDAKAILNKLSTTKQNKL